MRLDLLESFPHLFTCSVCFQSIVHFRLDMHQRLMPLSESNVSKGVSTREFFHFALCFQFVTLSKCNFWRLAEHKQGGSLKRLGKSFDVNEPKIRLFFFSKHVLLKVKYLCQILIVKAVTSNGCFSPAILLQHSLQHLQLL